MRDIPLMTAASIAAAQEAARQEREYIFQTTGVMVDADGKVLWQGKDAGRLQRPA